MLCMRPNRYATKRKHKRQQERHFANIYSYGSSAYGNINLLRDKLMREAEEEKEYRKHQPRNGGWEYWKIYYLTGRRKYAKNYSNRHIRQKYRQMIHKMEPEDVTAPRGADYEKEFDYAYTVW